MRLATIEYKNMKTLKDVNENFNKLTEVLSLSHQEMFKIMEGIDKRLNLNADAISILIDANKDLDFSSLDNEEGLSSMAGIKKEPKVLRGRFVPKYGETSYDARAEKCIGALDLSMGMPCFRTEEDARLYRKITERAHVLKMRYSRPNRSWDKKYLYFVCSRKAVVINTVNENWIIQGTLHLPHEAADTLLEEFTQQELRFCITGEWVD